MTRPMMVLAGLLLIACVGAAVGQEAAVLTYGGSAGSQAAFDTTVAGTGKAAFGEGQLVSELPFALEVAAKVDLKVLETTAEVQRRSLHVRDIDFRVNDQAQAQPDWDPMGFEVKPDGAIASIDRSDATTADPLMAAAADLQMLMILNQYLRFPADPVKSGDTWETREEVTTPSGKQLVITAKSTLEGRVGNVLQITTVLDTPMDLELPTLAIKTSGTAHAELKRSFDVERGMVVESKGPVAVSLKGTMGGEGGTPVSLTSTVETQLKPAEDEAAQPPAQ